MGEVQKPVCEVCGQPKVAGHCSMKARMQAYTASDAFKRNFAIGFAEGLSGRPIPGQPLPGVVEEPHLDSAIDPDAYATDDEIVDAEVLDG